jgi:uncharacterized membrane protein
VNSWELDALDPQVLVDLIRDRIVPHIDVAAWRAAFEADKDEKALIQAVADNWHDVGVYVADAGNWMVRARDTIEADATDAFLDRFADKAGDEDDEEDDEESDE